MNIIILNQFNSFISHTFLIYDNIKLLIYMFSGYLSNISISKYLSTCICHRVISNILLVHTILC